MNPILRTILKTAVQSVLDAIFGGGGSSTDLTPILKSINALATLDEWLIEVVNGLQVEMLAAIDGQQRNANDIGNDLKVLSAQHGDAIARLTAVIIPKSLQWLYDEIDNKLIKPLEHKLTGSKSDLSALNKRVTALETWRNKTVTPEISKVAAFMKLWNSWPLTTVKRTRDYYDKPDTFAKWLYPFVWKYITYEQATNHADPLVVALDAGLADEWPNAWRHVEQGLLGVLLQPYP